MAVCTKCGAPLTSATGSCNSCGTPIATGAPQAAPPPPGYPVAPTRSSGGALKIVLIVVAVVVGIGILGVGTLAYIGWRVSKAATAGITINSSGNGATVTVPGVGTVATGTSATVTAQDIGVPLYPGATQDTDSSQTTASNTTRVVQATFWTGDPVSSVTAFYQGKLGDSLTVMGLGDETIMNYGGGNNAVTMMVNSENGKTKINVIHSVTKGQ
jgi:hypothetical protein